MNKNAFVVLVIFSVLLSSCGTKTRVDLLVLHARIYTVDSAFSVVNAMAISKGQIVATGSDEALLQAYAATDTLDAAGKIIYPGLIDAHAHFVGYGLGLATVNLVDTQSWEEVLQRLKTAAPGTDSSDWLIGRGWDQNDWPVKEFPSKELLDQQFPERPVLLTRIDGHAAIANQKALDAAKLHAGITLAGGEVETKNGQLTGILIDNAVDLVSSDIPPPTVQKVKTGLLSAQRNCFAVGLTTVDDCGLDADAIQFIDSLQKTGELKMRIYAMLSDNKKNFDFAAKQGKIKTAGLNVRSFKVYADGALGSRGACLLQPYTDKPGWSGFLLSAPAHFDSVAAVIQQLGFQMCTHAIGDSGNRTILRTYEKYLKGKNDARWRIEHAQVVNTADFALFGNNSIIPSVQPTHATSDMYWADKRLGPEREKGAYALKQLLQQNGWLPLGTDFPVEDISPFKTFYAAVVRKDAKGYPATGFQMENAIDRQQALRGMTIWAAKANFEENEKGSLEKGKMADFILLDRDLMTTPPDQLLGSKVLATYINGQKVF
ncbi:MAG TPA: amidohydrolase [Chitinophagaceae bacterium]|nr:amidohydrolase [Chitinophagaceae bacterium]